MIQGYKRGMRIMNHSYQATLFKMYIDPAFSFEVYKNFALPNKSPEPDELETATINNTVYLTYTHAKKEEFFYQLTKEKLEEYLKEHKLLIKYIQTVKKLKVITSDVASITLKQYKDIVIIQGIGFSYAELEEHLEDTKEEPPQLTQTMEEEIEEILDKSKQKPEPILDEKPAIVSREGIRGITGYSYSPIIKDPADPFAPGVRKFIKWQKELLDATQRFVYVVGSRQMGKTYTLSQLAIEQSFIPENKIMVCAFETEVAHRMRDYILELSDKLTGMFTHQKKENYILNTVTKSKIYFRTLSDGATRIRGFTLNLVIIDEAAYISNDIYERVLFPTTVTTNGRIIAISSPDKRNWFYENVRKAEKGEIKDALAMTITIEDNPFIPDVEKEEIFKRKHSPIVRNEWYGEFIGAGSMLFTATKEENFPEISPQGYHVLGYDPARLADQAGLHLTYVHNGKAIGIHTEYMPPEIKKDWNKQAMYIKKIQDETDCFVVVDCTGVGDGVITILKNHGVRVDCVIRYTSGTSETVDKSFSFGNSEYLRVGKARMITNTLTYMEQGYYTFYPYTNKILDKECNEIEFTKINGLIAMSTSGYDDAANAMMINLYFINYKLLLTQTRHQIQNTPTLEDDIDTSHKAISHPMSRAW